MSIRKGNDIIASKPLVDAVPTQSSTNAVSSGGVYDAMQEITRGGFYHPDLFDFKWADHELNDVQWLRADTFSWQSGGVYEAAYNHLYEDYDSASWIIVTGGTKYFRAAGYDTTQGQYDYYGWLDRGAHDVVYTVDTQTPQINQAVYHSTSIVLPEVYANVTDSPYVQETIENITVMCRVGTDGHKICLPDQESNVAAIYAATGVAWYYIIDIANQRFKLPRTQYGVTGLRDTVGNYVAESLPNVWYSNGGYTSDPTIDGALTQIVRYNVSQNETSSSTRFIAECSFSATNCSSAYQDSAPVQQRATQMYLYFYVGEFTQTALENTAGIRAEDLNNKVDVGHQVIAFQAPTAANNYTWYRKYADGWVEQGGLSNVSTSANSSSYMLYIPLLVEMADANYTGFCGANFAGGSSWNGPYILTSDCTTTTAAFNGWVTGATTINAKSWYVCGMAA